MPLRRFYQRGHNLRRIGERCLHWKRSAFEPGCNRLALHQLHYEVIRPNVVERADVGMIQRRNRARLTLETRAKSLMSGLESDGAAQSRVNGQKDFSHSTLAEFAFDTVGPQPQARPNFG